MSESLCGYCFKEYAPSCCEKSEYENVKRQLTEAREAIKEHKKRKKSWGFEGSDYDKVLWEQLKEK